MIFLNKTINKFKKIINKINIILTSPFVNFVQNNFIFKPYIHGDKKRIHLGERVSLVNTILNTASGHIYIGDDTIMGHNCVFATGIHLFENGKRRKIYYKEKYNQNVSDTPTSGYDIKIGKGCWITSNVTIIGGVTIGDNVIVSAGSVVTKDIPDSVIVAGVPAKIVKRFDCIK